MKSLRFRWNARHSRLIFLIMVGVVSLNLMMIGCSDRKRPAYAAPTLKNSDVPDLPSGPTTVNEAEGEPSADKEPLSPTGEPSDNPTGTQTCIADKCTPIEAPPPATPVTSDTKPVQKEKFLCEDSHSPQWQPPEGLICPTCFNQTFQQPQAKQTKLDILFVADSSPSLETERTAIAKGVRQFIDALPQNTDYNIAVMAAHSDVSYDPKVKPTPGFAGKLLKSGNEPAVLKSASLQWNKLSEILIRRLTKIKSDASTDGGEAGLFSLEKGITEPLLSENRGLGFFRGDAALAIIFISDENDLCAVYPAGITPKENKNKYLDTGLSVEDRAKQAYCRDSNGNPTVTPESVYVKLRNLHRTQAANPKPAATGGTPEETSLSNTSPSTSTPVQAVDASALMISGILYTNPESVPTVPAPDEKFPEYFGENEMGYGYMDLIRLNESDLDGVTVDISKDNFGDGLKKIGETARWKMEIRSQFQLKEGQTVDPKSICVLVNNTEVQEVTDFRYRVEGMTYLYKASFREINVRGVGAADKTDKSGRPSKVQVFYCEPPSMISVAPEVYFDAPFPTHDQHYKNLVDKKVIPAACKSLISRIQSGALD